MKIVLTHDVDSIRKPLRHVLSVRKRFEKRDLALHLLGFKNLYNNIDELVSLEDKYGVRSTFFIPVDLFPISEIADTVRSVKAKGWEIALHFVTEGNQEEGFLFMKKEFLESLFGQVFGVRTHNLVINEALLSIFEKSGFKYDSSLRAETAKTYKPFKIRKNLVEIPIGVMDADLFGRLKMGEEEARKYILTRMEKARVEGFFTVLFHQESFKMRGGRLYKEILRHIMDKGYKTACCIDAAGASRD
jgi:peptidoglycan/xylan/chitin deacetylase (PgdA/CDA1 family)